MFVDTRDNKRSSSSRKREQDDVKLDTTTPCLDHRWRRSFDLACHLVSLVSIQSAYAMQMWLLCISQPNRMFELSPSD